MKKLLVIAAVAAAMCAQAQEALPSLRVAGSVAGSDSLPLKDATVTLLSLPDTLFVRSTLSDAEGRFDLGDVQSPEKFLLNVHAFNHDPSFLSLDGSGLHVTLQPSSKMLKEVVVRANAQPRLTMDHDKLVCVPTGMMLDAVNAVRMLRLVPMLDVGRQSVNVLGRGNAKIYINGKDPHMPEDMLFAELRQLDPTDVLKVEIIVNPGASLSAREGRAIVNIKVRNRLDGFTGSLGVKGSYHNEGWHPGSTVAVGMRRGKFKALASATYSYTYDRQSDCDYFEYHHFDRRVINQEKGSTHGNRIAAAINMTYEPTKAARFGLSGNISGSATTATLGTLTSMWAAGNESQSYYFMRSRSPMQYPSFGVVAFYDLQTDSRGSMLEIRADYGQNRDRSEYDRYIYEDYILERRYSFNEGYSARIKYTHVFPFGMRMDIGGSGYIGHLKRYEERGAVCENERYRNSDATAFLQLNHSFSRNFNITAGVRLSYYRFKVKGDRPYSDKSLDPIPNATLTYSIPAGNQIFILSYEYFAIRPSYSNLNPYITWTSDNSYYQGNPDLKSSKIHCTSLNYQFLDGFSLNIRYDVSKDLIKPITYISPEGMAVTTHANCGRFNFFNASLGYRHQILPFWTLSAGVGCDNTNQEIHFQNYRVESSTWSFGGGVGSIFTLSKRHGLTCDIHAGISGMFVQPNGKQRSNDNVRISVDKKFSFGDLSIFAMVPFRRNAIDVWVNTDEYYRYTDKRNTPSIQVYFNYYFGKRKTSVARSNSSTTLDTK